MLGLVFLIVCSFILSDSLTVNNHERTCLELQECTSEIEQHEHQNLQPSLESSEENAVEDFCRLTRDSAQCVLRTKSSCREEFFVNEAEKALDPAQYICSEEGRAALGQVRRSECLHNVEKQEQVSAATENCGKDYFRGIFAALASAGNRAVDSADLCPIVDAWTGCLVRVARETCGPEYGNYLSGLLNASERSPLPRMNCRGNNREKRAYIRRAGHVVKRLTGIN